MYILQNVAFLYNIVEISVYNKQMHRNYINFVKLICLFALLPINYWNNKILNTQECVRMF